ncbi:hypothetical protein [Actinomadura sp. HBU206391]|uniref:hypothetical protein n=1 Tax=Actinomadura sp. HBU206391 TaxID=2731692 RepID=UPI00164F4DF4|nr:hypothetical protein [Actinomadura sp. HBU206391]MBC6463751.1 hypothetical protein [Actinomadura sp. HBU206391]
MDTRKATDDELLARLRREYPGHRIWRSVRYDGLLGDWVATLHDPAAGVDATVIRPTADELRAELDAERSRAAQRPRTQ